MGWISVKDRKPKIYQNVLVCVKGEVHEGLLGKMFWSVPNCESYCNNDVTHWMPLPEPPNEE